MRAMRALTPLPAAVSTAMAPLWRGPDREVVVLAVFPRAVYATVGDDLLAIVTADGIGQPNAAVVRPNSVQRPFAGVRAGHRGRVGGHRLTVGELQVTVARWWEPRPRLAPFDPAALTDGAAIAAARVRSIAGETPTVLRRPLADVVAGLGAADPDVAFQAALRLLGCGPGLTPAGDDVLAGVVSGTLLLAPGGSGSGGSGSGGVGTAAAALGARIAAAAPGCTTTISAALLHHAARAEVALPAARFIHALTGRGEVSAATDELLAVGSTSGRDLAVGVLAAASLVVDDTSTVVDDTSTVREDGATTVPLREAC